MDESVSWYTQAVVPQYMVEAHCGSLDSMCTIRSTPGVLSGASSLSISKAHHGSKDVPDEQEVLVSLNLHRLTLQSCKTAFGARPDLRISAINNVAQ